ncbi:hypothetical protein [Bradyrhizobium sp. Cp5.3]|uniref:hypothetical protein n=1 Tax=Bradyrhizobium sp. Cp5.3 TaxID=443598 RepID=UPI0003F83959|nr:hypothetical protein [Bradyrhizobium sp. Cp5.3]
MFRTADVEGGHHVARGELEAVRADGAVEFFYCDDNAGRRAITGSLSRESALAKA